MASKKITTAQLLEHMYGIKNELLTEIHSVKFGTQLQIDDLKQRFDGLEVRFDGLEQKVDVLHDDIKEIKTLVIDSAHQQKSMYKRVENLEVAVGINS